MDNCFIDFESRSTINLKTHQVDRYMTEAEATLCTWAINNGPVKCWDIYAGEPLPDDLRPERRKHYTFIAINYGFDRAITERLLLWGTDIRQWHCVRAQAYSVGLPGGLDGLGEVLQIGDNFTKLKSGEDLIQFFCVPQKDGTYRRPEDHPSKWLEFKEYAMRDIDALRAIYRRLPMHNFRGVNLDYFHFDGLMNERGFAVDLDFVDSAIECLERTKKWQDRDVAKATGNAVTAITQRAKLLAYFESKGLLLPNMRKGELEKALQRDDISPELKWLITERLEGSKASGGKYKKAKQLHVGGRIRYSQQCNGAGRTGRTAHKGFQPGNMPRAVTFNVHAQTLADQHVPVKAKFIDEVIMPAIRDKIWRPEYDLIIGSPQTACSNALRHTIRAEPGNVLIAADYRNVESVGVAWLAGEDGVLANFRKNFAAKDKVEKDRTDTYRNNYVNMFGGALEAVNDHQRNSSKVVILSCGFGGSVGAFVTMSAGYGMDLSTLPSLVLPGATAGEISKAEKVWWTAFCRNEDYALEPDVYMAIHVLVQKYRAANPAIDRYKRELGRAVENAIKVRGECHHVRRVKVWADADALYIELPSTRRLVYWHPEIKSEKQFDPEDGEEIKDRNYIVFRAARGKRMVRERAWPGLFVANTTQASCNDLFRYGNLQVDKAFPRSVVLGVHDEILAEVRKGTMTVDDMVREMCKRPWWADDFPLAAEGWENSVYGKR